MNSDFEIIKSILVKFRSDYKSGFEQNIFDQSVPITERDIVAEIYNRLKNFCNEKGLSVHCEIKPAPNENAEVEVLKRLPRIDVVILSNRDEQSWIASAMKLQDKYKKGLIEARFSSIPIEFFHTAIEVKIQSNIANAKDDIDNLRKLHDTNNSCNCFFVLLNARGQKSDHNAIKKYADHKGVCILDYTCK